jgi:hypothetical protein
LTVRGNPTGEPLTEGDSKALEDVRMFSGSMGRNEFVGFYVVNKEDTGRGWQDSTKMLENYIPCVIQCRVPAESFG